ncbi:MAG: transcriptional regulator [Sphingobacteriales bacterium]|nr:transcriptional regulator [Sphingobacteriales bacterium]
MFKSENDREIIRKREKKGLPIATRFSINSTLTQLYSVKLKRGERKGHKRANSKLADILELDKESLLIQYLSEKILYEIQDEDLGIQALKVAEKTIKYGVTKNK